MKKQEDPTSRCCFAVICFFVLAVGFTVGIVVGMFVICSQDDQVPAVIQPTNEEYYGKEYLYRMMEDIRTDFISEKLRYLSESPHLAGSARNKRLADFISDLWTGVDELKTISYDVLLSFPDDKQPNQVYLIGESGRVLEKSPLAEQVFTSGENNTEVVAPFLAYSANGTVEGKMVYVNYGRVEDYGVLEQKKVNVSGHIVVARYGKIYRGDKVMLAERHGAMGIIIYSDPKDFRPHGVTDVYPDDWWLPPTGAQRGSVFEGLDDPLTPGYPATEFAYRIKEKDADPKLPGIPAHVVGYGFAEKILSQMGGERTPEEWKGDLNLTYRLGPDFLNDKMSVRLSVSTQNERRQIFDVIGIIRGHVEPDRYIVVGNHRDAWVFGAMDPSSGTAIMTELVRVLNNEIAKGKWRPRRTIIFCSWDAEEYALLGSTEFVQSYVKNLFSRAVAYVNVDIAVEGKIFGHFRDPIQWGMQSDHGNAQRFYIRQISVTSPDDSDTSVYDEWLARQEMKNRTGSGLRIPKYSFPGAGSDYANFLDIAGVPVLDLRYIYNDTKWDLGDYPLYHSEYETFYAVENFVDPGFKYHRTLGQVWLAAIFHLSESVFLPFNVSFYAWTLQDMREQLLQDYDDLLKEKLPGYDTNLTLVIQNFTDTAAEFMSRRNRISMSDVMSIRRYNDQLLQFERAFLDTNGIPGRTYLKHILFAPSSVNSYAGSSFPGLVDLLYKIQESADTDSQWEKVKQHFSVILFAIQSATSTLKEVISFL